MIDIIQSYHHKCRQYCTKYNNTKAEEINVRDLISYIHVKCECIKLSAASQRTVGYEISE